MDEVSVGIVGVYCGVDAESELPIPDLDDGAGGLSAAVVGLSCRGLPLSCAFGFAGAVRLRLAALRACGVALTVAGWQAASCTGSAADANVVGPEVDVVACMDREDDTFGINQLNVAIGDGVKDGRLVAPLRRWAAEACGGSTRIRRVSRRWDIRSRCFAGLWSRALRVNSPGLNTLL